MKYGQHETFHLRLNWLRKGIKMIKVNPRFFFEKEAAETIKWGIYFHEQKKRFGIIPVT